MFKKLKKFASKKTLVVLGLMAFCTAGLFADADLGAIDDASDKMIEVISSKPVKVVCIAGLLAVFGACIWGQTQGEGSFIKKLMPTLYGIAGVLGTVGIVNWIFSGVTVDTLSMQQFQDGAQSIGIALANIANSFA